MSRISSSLSKNSIIEIKEETTSNEKIKNIPKEIETNSCLDIQNFEKDEQIQKWSINQNSTIIQVEQNNFTTTTTISKEHDEITFPNNIENIENNTNITNTNNLNTFSYNVENEKFDEFKIKANELFAKKSVFNDVKYSIYKSIRNKKKSESKIQSIKEGENFDNQLLKTDTNNHNKCYNFDSTRNPYLLSFQNQKTGNYDKNKNISNNIFVKSIFVKNQEEKILIIKDSIHKKNDSQMKDPQKERLLAYKKNKYKKELIKTVYPIKSLIISSDENLEALDLKNNKSFDYKTLTLNSRNSISNRGSINNKLIQPNFNLEDSNMNKMNNGNFKKRSLKNEKLNSNSNNAILHTEMKNIKRNQSGIFNKNNFSKTGFFDKKYSQIKNPILNTCCSLSKLIQYTDDNLEKQYNNNDNHTNNDNNNIKFNLQKEVDINIQNSILYSLEKESIYLNTNEYSNKNKNENDNSIRNKNNVCNNIINPKIKIKNEVLLSGNKTDRTLTNKINEENIISSQLKKIANMAFTQNNFSNQFYKNDCFNSNNSNDNRENLRYIINIKKRKLSNSNKDDDIHKNIYKTPYNDKRFFPQMQNISSDEIKNKPLINNSQLDNSLNLNGNHNNNNDLNISNKNENNDFKKELNDYALQYLPCTPLKSNVKNPKILKNDFFLDFKKWNSYNLLKNDFLGIKESPFPEKIDKFNNDNYLPKININTNNTKNENDKTSNYSKNIEIISLIKNKSDRNILRNNNMIKEVNNQINLEKSNFEVKDISYKNQTKMHFDRINVFNEDAEKNPKNNHIANKTENIINSNSLTKTESNKNFFTNKNSNNEKTNKDLIIVSIHKPNLFIKNSDSKISKSTNSNFFQKKKNKLDKNTITFQPNFIPVSGKEFKKIFHYEKDTSRNNMVIDPFSRNIKLINNNQNYNSNIDLHKNRILIHDLIKKKDIDSQKNYMMNDSKFIIKKPNKFFLQNDLRNQFIQTQPIE